MQDTRRLAEASTVAMSRQPVSSIPIADRGLLSGRYWGELRIFAEVARAKSFNRAAESLGVSQPTIGRKVRRLQDLIGARLFVSTKQGVHLTPRGEELAAALRVLDQSLFAIANDLRARDEDAEGIVSIAMTDGMAAWFAAPAAAEFSARYPKVRLHFKSIVDLSDLRANQVDLMLTFAPTPQPNTRCEPVGTMNLVPLASKGYVAKHGLPTRETVADHLFLQSHAYQTERPAWRDWQALCAQGRVAHYCDNSFAYAMLARQGLGIALLGTYLINEGVPFDLGVHVSLPMYAMALEERLESRSVRVAFDWLCETFSESRPWFRRETGLDGLPEDFTAVKTMFAGGHL